VCNKGFQDRHKLQAHHRQHGREEGPAQQAAAKVVGSAAVELMLALAPTATPSEPPMRTTVACGTCGGRVPRDDADAVAFECGGCGKWQHWTCGGVPKPPTEPPTQPLCTACLVAAGYHRTGVAEAVVGRAMAAAYAKQQGGDVWRADPDGWCLLACVERALGGADRTLLLQQALHVISEGGVLGAQAEQQAAANEMLLVATQSSQRQLNQKVAKLWDSDVWDAMPAALSRVVGRSLHVVSGNARSGQVSLTVVDEAVGAAGAPVRLIRSGHEYGCAHYDLVEAQLLG